MRRRFIKNTAYVESIMECELPESTSAEISTPLSTTGTRNGFSAVSCGAPNRSAANRSIGVAFRNLNEGPELFKFEEFDGSRVIVRAG